MKQNLPITDREITLTPDQELVTKTDLKGRIVYANPAFIEVSGYSREELVGSSHNIVRHPSMPQAAFKDLWDTLKLGRPWSRLVKNRCKNGDYYWVKANVTPVYKDSQIIEYMSVRTMASEQEIADTEKEYDLLNKQQKVLRDPGSISESNLQRLFDQYALIALGAGLLLSLMLYLGGASGEYLALGPIGAFVGLYLAAKYYVRQRVIEPLASIKDHLITISQGDYLRSIDLREEGELGALKRSANMLGVKLGFEVNDARENEARTQRIKAALDNASACVMLVDSSNRISYVNDAVVDMLKRSEQALKPYLPEVDFDDLVGTDSAVFKQYRQTEQNTQMLGNQSSVLVVIGSCTYELTFNPVLDNGGRRIGTVVEWLDKTEQLKAESAVQVLIEQAAQGELDGRLDLQDFSGFLGDIAQGINELLDSLTSPLQEIKRVLQSAAEGDLTEQMQGEFSGEFQQLNEAVNASISNLAHMVSEIRHTGANITTGASEIARGNSTLSSRTEAQAASLQETAASMEQMTSIVKQNADHAEQAKSLSSQAQQMAVKGGEITDSAVRSMAEIQTSSNKISEILTVIDEIAFQTNLLALNAAVEAARAGEQGRGFAVVASEVRNLAQRSAGAAKEIKTLIKDSAERVAEGNAYVGESGKALSDIISSIDNVSTIVAEIASASREQAIGIEQVNAAVTQMDDGVQQNAALVEQVAAASTSLDGQALELKKLVSAFAVAGQPGADSADDEDIQVLRQMSTEQALPEAPKPVPVERVFSVEDSSEEWQEF